MRHSPHQRGSDPLFLDPPVPVLDAVDQDHRHPVAVLAAPLRVAVDVLDGPFDAQLTANPPDIRLGRRAGMAVAAAHQGDLHVSIPRRLARRSLPVTECGSASTNSTTPGTLNLARRSAQCSRTACSVSAAPGRSTTTALTRSPVRSSGTPTAADSATPSSSPRTRSTSCGYTLKPLTMIRSLARSTRCRSP